MTRALPYVDPNRRTGWFGRLIAAFSATPVGRFLSAKLLWRLDPYVLRATGGRVGLAFPLPTAVLETRGAKSGAQRRNAVIYFHDGDTVTIVASRAGDVRHPAWFHNLRANPDVVFGGMPMRASGGTADADRARLWTLADRVFAPYAADRRRTAAIGRTIPIIQLTPRA